MLHRMTLIGHTHSSQFMKRQNLGIATLKYGAWAPKVFKKLSENQITTDFVYLTSSNFVTISHINYWDQVNSWKNLWTFIEISFYSTNVTSWTGTRTFIDFTLGVRVFIFQTEYYRQKEGLFKTYIGTIPLYFCVLWVVRVVCVVRYLIVIYKCAYCWNHSVYSWWNLCL